MDQRVDKQMKESGQWIREHMKQIESDPEIMAILKPVFDKVENGPIK